MPDEKPDLPAPKAPPRGRSTHQTATTRGTTMAEATITPEEKPPAIETDGMLQLWLAPKGAVADPHHPKAEELTAEAVHPVTYGLTTEGFATASEQAKGTDDRLTLPQIFETLGKVTNTLDLTYVYTNDPLTTSAMDAAFGSTGGDFEIYARYAIANGTPLLAGQLLDVWPFRAGIPVKNPPVANERFTKTVTTAIQAPGVITDAVLA